VPGALGKLSPYTAETPASTFVQVRIRAVVVPVSLCATLLACGSSGPSSSNEAAAESPPLPAVTSQAPASPVQTIKPTPSCRPASLERQAAATLVVGLPGTTSPNDPLAISMPALGVGGILLTANNVQSTEQIRTLISALRSRSKNPLIIGTDEEGGRVTSFSSILGWQSSARDLAPQGSEALREHAATLGRQLKGLGVTLDFAPVLDVTDAPWDSPIGDRSFSGDPSVASKDALAVARGLSEAGITPVLKHFPGLGDADADTHLTAPVVTTPAWGLIYKATPFVDAIKAGAPVVMVGHAQYPALDDTTLPASLSPAIYQRLRKVPFTGVAITDSLGMGAVNLRFDFPVAAVKALAAGSDGLLTTDGNQALRMRDAIVAAVRGGVLPKARLADAAARMTALAGGDAHALTCENVTLPALK
jgi:beta-N-acetylhexosaminidase